MPASAPSPISSSRFPASADDAGTGSAGRDLILLLREFERVQDEAFAIGGRLATALVAAQAEQRLAPSVGHPVFQALSEALGHLTAGRGATVEGHRKLEAIQRLFRIDVRMDEGDYGDSSKYPPSRADGTGSVTSIAA